MNFQSNCPSHEEFATAALISFELDGAVAERIYARAAAYGIGVQDVLGRMISAGLALGLDAPQ